MLYAFLAWCARHAMRWCYRDVQVAGTVPPTGPVLLAVNHPNDLADVCALLAHVPRRITFVANVTAAEQPLVGFVYDRLGVVPVHRVRDARKARARGQDSAEANRSAFARVRDVLAAGGCVCVFPEGGVHAGPRLGTLRTGLARMALHARSGIPGLAIVPVGLCYEAPMRLRTRVFLEAGAPLAMDTWAPDPPALPDVQLTAEIGARLQAVVTALHAHASVPDNRQGSRLASSGPGLALLAPFALLGLLLHAPAWALIRRLATRIAPTPQEVIPRIIAPGLHGMMLWYQLAAGALGVLLVRLGLAPWIAVFTAPALVFTLFPPLATLGLRWRDALLGEAHPSPRGVTPV